MSDAKKGEGLVYKNHPLRRVDNLIYYGSMADEYIVMLQILETKKEKDMDVATRVSVQLQLTAPDLKSRDRVVKKKARRTACTPPWTWAPSGWSGLWPANNSSIRSTHMPKAPHICQM